MIPTKKKPYVHYQKKKQCECGTYISTASSNSSWKPRTCARCVRLSRTNARVQEKKI